MALTLNTSLTSPLPTVPPSSLGGVWSAARRRIGSAASKVFGRFSALKPHPPSPRNDNPQGPQTTYPSQSNAKASPSSRSQWLSTAIKVSGIGAALLLAGYGLYASTTGAALLGFLQQGPTLLQDASALSGRAAAVAARYAPEQLTALVQTHPLATLVAAIPTTAGLALAGRSLVRRLVKKPDTGILTPQAETEPYETKVVCQGGPYKGDTFSVNVSVPKGCSPEEKEAIVQQLEENVLRNLENILIEQPVNIKIEANGWKATTPGGKLLRERILTPATAEHRERATIATLHTFLHGKGDINAKRAAVKQGLANILASPTRLPIGFTNNRNDCFLNSIMQALLAIPQVCEKMRTCTKKELRELVRQYEERMRPGTGPLNLKNLRKKLPGSGNTNFDDEGQHDVHECLLAILQFMRNDQDNYLQEIYADKINCSMTGSSDSPQRPDQHEPSRQYPDMTIYAQNFPRGIEAALKEELFGNVAEAPNLRNSTAFSEPPPFLPFHLVRERADGDPDRTECNAPLVLHFPQGYLYPKLDGSTWTEDERTYKLESFTVHSSTPSSGHYVGYRRTIEQVNGEEQIFYWEMDNEKVQRILETEFLDAAKKANNLFYVRNDKTQKPLAVRGSPRVFATALSTPPTPPPASGATAAPAEAAPTAVVAPPAA